MCGRYTLHANKKALTDAIALALPKDYKPNYNIGPGRETLSIVTCEKVQFVSKMMHWGWVHWILKWQRHVTTVI